MKRNTSAEYDQDQLLSSAGGQIQAANVTATGMFLQLKGIFKPRM